MIKREIKYLLLAIVALVFVTQPISAHPGGTDANGGHYCRTNCAKWGLQEGEYHYHNGGGAPPPATPAPVSPVPAPTPKSVNPVPKPDSVPVPKPKKSIETLNNLVKENKKEKVLLVDLLLRESSKAVTTSNYQTINAQQEAKARISGATQEPRVVNDQKLYYVNSVTDGDTIRVVMDGKVEKVRLLGIDTPETKDPRKPVQCFGTEASNYAKTLMSGKYVRLEEDPSQGDRDRYNRLLRYVYLEDDTEVNAQLVASGYAVAYVRYPVMKMETYKSLQTQAMNNNIGLWSACR